MRKIKNIVLHRLKIMRKIKNIGFALAIDNAQNQKHCFAQAKDNA